MTSSKISVSFTILGTDSNSEDLDPDKITAIVGIQPTKMWKVGDLVSKRSTLRHKQNGWSFKSKLEESATLEDHISYIFEQLKPNWQNLVEICTHYYTEIECAIYFYEDDIPAIHFERQSLKLISELNAEIDIDIYDLSES
ncbi:DUF4279 domain-containing protein [Chroococcidiopsis sp. FACHB-1243]|uniref:DUF4279 domain-containing protein n=1 Tax=Chroococcidiopsis sp. [FACHB-1243] TaxID=2692781 RepID=UPI00177AAF9F|nr:DUF4279 domain-containing protein [Chroococcidiopsis sp. [FACHB-1243]]MBD2307081.1 DUF4279 domain-containing protein [Chroococcidiopsis sp. [FACHB-1243]]